MLSIAFVLTTVACIVIIARIPSGYTYLVWLPYAFFIQLGFLALMSGILFLMQVGFTLWWGVCSNLILALLIGIQWKAKGSSFAWRNVRWRLPHSKKPLFAKLDVAVWVLLVILCAVCAYRQFGIPPAISFASTDAAAHTAASYALATGEVGVGQYLSHLATGSLMAVFEFAIDQETSYVIFEAGEVLFLFLSGASFYTLISALCHPIKALPALITVLLYTLGYPLNNMLFGFSYLGLAVTIICVLVFACMTFSCWNRATLSLSFISLLLLEVITSYSLFVPVIFLSIFILLFRAFRNQGHRNGLSIFLSIIPFVAPVILGFLIVYSTYFIIGNNTIGSAIAGEGGSFRDLYAGFIFVAPLAGYGFWSCWKEKAAGALTLITSLFVLFSLVLCCLCALQFVSTYYFYKTYYVLWLLFFANAVYGVHTLRIRSLPMLVCYALTWLIVFSLAFSGLDTKLNTARPRLNPNPVAETLFPVYVYNLEYADFRKLSDGTVELLEFADGLKDEGSKVALTSNDTILRWWMALYGGDYYDFMWWHYTDEEMITALEDYDYVFVSYDDPVLRNQSGNPFLDVLNGSNSYDFDASDNIVYSNESGMIVKAPPKEGILE